jgi:hypothetical protein
MTPDLVRARELRFPIENWRCPWCGRAGYFVAVKGGARLMPHGDCTGAAWRLLADA